MLQIIQEKKTVSGIRVFKLSGNDWVSSVSHWATLMGRLVPLKAYSIIRLVMRIT